MGTPEIPLEAIYERDIDLLLLEELSVASEFASWLVDRAHTPEIKLGSVEGAFHSVIEGGRESDLVLTFRDSAGNRRAILIENKINAIAQPDQSGGYLQRAATGTADGRWTSATTCIIAPDSYLLKDAEAKRYDARISYELIAAWFELHTPASPRYRYRAQIMRGAIEQARRARIAQEDPLITAFWKAYWDDCSKLYPELELESPGIKSPGSTWIVFRPKLLKKTRTIDHKLLHGVVDLSMPNVPAAKRDQLEKQFLPIIAPYGMAVAVTGKSLAIRASVPELDPRLDYASQVAGAQLGMKAAYRAWVLAGVLDPGP